MERNQIKNDQAVSIISLILSVMLVILLSVAVANFAVERYGSTVSKKAPNILFTDVKASETNGISTEVIGTDNISVNEIRVIYGINGEYPTNDADITSPTDYISGGDILKADISTPQANSGDTVWVKIIHKPSGTVVVDATSVFVSG